MNATDTWTIGRLLTWTTEFLKKNGSSSPRLDCEVLLAHARQCQRIELYTAFAEDPGEEVRAAFREMVRRRAEGTPVAYLVGYKEFYSERFEVNPDVLIPRPETEHLIVEALDRARQIQDGREKNDEQPLRIADVGTGSGIIAITLARQVPNAQVIAVDCSAAALELARRNVERFELPAERLQLVESDLLDQCRDQQFDLILSNPPYISQLEYDQLENTVRDFEPAEALLSGPEGYEVLVKLQQQSLAQLAPDGFLILELSPMLAKRQAEWLDPAWQLQGFTKDLAGYARVATLTPKAGTAAVEPPTENPST